MNVKTVGEMENEMMEFSYYINLKNESRGTDPVADIKRIDGIKSVNLFFDED